MTINDATPVASPTQYHVTLAKGQEEQHETVVNELLNSVKQNVNAEQGLGRSINTVA